MSANYVMPGVGRGADQGAAGPVRVPNRVEGLEGVRKWSLLTIDSESTSLPSPRRVTVT
jgi:hypothetical protein